MKIAILVCGMYREFETAVKSWDFLNKLDCDVFFSTWDHTYEKHYSLGIDISESVTVERIRKNIQPIRFSIDNEIIAHHLNSKQKMILRWKRAISLMKFSGIKYDAVILIRPDLSFEHSKGFEEILDTLSPNILYSDVDFLNNTMNDHLFFGKFDTICALEKLSTDTIDEHTDIHKWLFHNISKLVSLSSMLTHILCPYCITRSNARGLYNIKEIDACTKIWWDSLHPSQLPYSSQWTN